MTISPNKKRKPDDMNIDALTKKGKSHKDEGKNKTERQKASCFVCGRVGHMTKHCWFKNTNKAHTIKDCWFKDTSESGLPSNKYRKGKGKGQRKRNELCQRDCDFDRVDSNTYRRNDYLYKPDLEITQHDVGITLIHRIQMRSKKLDTSRQQSNTESHPINPRMGTLFASWWIIVRTSICVTRKTSSGLISSQARIPI